MGKRSMQVGESGFKHGQGQVAEESQLRQTTASESSHSYTRGMAQAFVSQGQPFPQGVNGGQGRSCLYLTNVCRWYIQWQEWKKGDQ